MDLLFSKYASPFLLLDEIILNNRFCDFVIEIMNSENERKTWEFYLHKVFDKSYEDFKSSLGSDSVRTEKISKTDLETTILNSKNTLNNFRPI